MKQARNILALLLAVLWLPATSHCLLESAGLIHNASAHSDAGHDDGEDADGDHDAADGICRLDAKDGCIQPVHVESFLPLLAWLNDCLVGTQSMADAESIGLDPPGVAPPDVSVTWQFSVRAALLARAPSLAS